MNELQQLLISGNPLWLTTDGYRTAMLAQFPLPHCGFHLEPKDYFKATREAAQRLTGQLQELDEPVTLVADDFESDELPADTVAYHRVWGFITADSRRWFSSKQLELDLMAAEANPQISSHLLHVNSPGGEAWYLDRLGETLDACRKPVVALCEGEACSAAYFIACHARRLYCLTQNDFMGCIGTMTSFYDFEPYYEKLGIKHVEVKATQSDLKNKMFDDVRHDRPDQYRERVLDPLNSQFLRAVKSHRPLLADIENSAPVLRGETFYTPEAIELGLADGQRTLPETVGETAALGRQWSQAEREWDTIYSRI